MYRKTLLSVFAGMVSIPFSFVRMKGPVSEEKAQLNVKGNVNLAKLEKNEEIHFENERDTWVILPYLCLYNSKIGYIVSYNLKSHLEGLEVDIKSNNLVLDFFQGINNLKELIKNKPTILLDFKKSKFKFTEEEWKNTKLYAFYSESNRNDITPDITIKYGFKSFYINSIKTDSGIIIDNQEDRVMIKKSDGLNRNFYQVLYNYYKKPYEVIRDTVIDLYQNKIDRERNLKYNTYTVIKAEKNRVKGESSFKLLKKSTILCVYGVLKGEQGKDSIILGLARNNETEKNFHWLVDLEDKDISTLLN